MSIFNVDSRHEHAGRTECSNFHTASGDWGLDGQNSFLIHSIYDIEEKLGSLQSKCFESMIKFLEIELKKFVDNKLISIGQAELIPIVHLTFDKSSNQFQIVVKAISIFSNGKSGNAKCDVDLLEALG